MASPPVTFPCPFCSRRMGVHTELLGRQVRCPHCKRVVIAPAAAGTPSAPPPPEPEIRPFNIPQKEGADSILSESDESDDEVFISPANTPTRPILFPSPQQSSEPESEPAPEPGASASAGLKLFPESSDSLPDQAPQTLVTGPEPGRHASAFSAPPVLEPKAEPPSPLTSLNSDPEREDTLPPPSDSPRPDEGNPFTGFEPDPLPLPFVKAPKAPELPAPNTPPSEPAPSKKPLLDETPADREEKPARAERSRPTPVAASSRAKGTVLVLLAGYALVVTVLAFYGLFFKSRGVPETGHPLSTIPDTFGEFDPVSRKKVTKLDFPVDSELPAAQRAQLGGKITIGQLEVEPIRVQKRPLQMILEGTDEKDKQTLRAGTALVMTIAIKNLSSDTPIYPMDPAFLRRASKDDQPITRLVIGHKVFAGGDIEWPLPSRFKKKIEVQQGNDAKILEPRHSQEYIVFTEANPDLITAAESSREALQWRVQVRRGLIDYRGKEVPVTAVIGVDFKASDIRGMD